MARIDSNIFDKLEVNKTREHAPVHAGYFVFDGGNGRILQINMYDSEERKNSGLTSQCIQIDKDMALRLVALFKEAGMLSENKNCQGGK